jgi:hypothetical protein
MDRNCSQSITPVLIEDPCGGEKKSTQCIISLKALTYLQLPAESSLEDIIDNLILSLSDVRTRLSAAETKIEELESRIEILEP